MNHELGFVGEISTFYTGPLTADERVFIDRITDKQRAIDGNGNRTSKAVITQSGHREDVFGDSPELKRLADAVDLALYQYVMKAFPEIGQRDMEIRRVGCWLNIGTDGKDTHTHDSDFSAVFYLDDTEGEDGHTVMLNPVNPHLNCGSGLLQGEFRRGLRIKPIEGNVLIFPGYIEHAVEPYSGGTPRRTFGIDYTAFDSK